MTRDELAAAIGRGISDILDAVNSYAAGQIALAVTPGKAGGEPVPTFDEIEAQANPAIKAGIIKPASQREGDHPVNREQLATVLDLIAGNSADEQLRSNVFYVAKQLRGSGFIILPPGWTRPEQQSPHDRSQHVTMTP